MLPGGRAVVLTLASFTWLLGFSLAFERRFSVSVLWSMSKVLLMVTLRERSHSNQYISIAGHGLRYLILLASLMASFASTDGDGSLTMDLSNESSSLSLSDKPLLTLHNDIHNTERQVRNTQKQAN